MFSPRMKVLNTLVAKVISGSGHQKESGFFVCFLMEFMKVLNCSAILTFFFPENIQYSQSPNACSLNRYSCFIGIWTWSLAWFWYFTVLNVSERNETQCLLCAKVKLVTWVSPTVGVTDYLGNHAPLLKVLKMYYTKWKIKDTSVVAFGLGASW